MKVTRGPTNIDLINILRSRIEQDKRPSFIAEMHNLYEKEPWLIQHVRHVSSVENLWFYFVRRKQRPGIKKSDSKRPSRKVVGSGRWKTTGVLTENKDRVGSVKTISFKANSETVKDGITTGWVMHEFVLDKPGFQELALCRIRFYPREDNAQYAPRLTPTVIGLERQDGSKLVENNSQNHMTSIHHGAAAPVKIHQDQGMEQWSGSCSGEVVSNLALQHQNIMAQDSNYPIFNGGMKKHQDFRSYGQQKTPVPGHMEQYQGSGDRVEYQNQYLGQEMMDPKKVPMMVNQALNEYSGHLPSQQHQHFSLNGSKEQLQRLSSCGGLLGESSGQQQHHSLGRQATYLSLMEVQLSAQAMEEQQGNGYSALYPSKPYVQRMMDRQIFGSYALRMAQKNEYLRLKNDLLALSELDAPKRLSQDSNLPLTQPEKKILGQATHNVQCSAQPYDQYKGQNNELPTIPMKTQIQKNELTTVPISFKTQQQQDAFIRNSAAQLHLEAQDDVPLIDQTIEAQATDPPIDSQKHQELLGDDFFQGMDTEMADLPDDFCVGDLAQQFEKIPIPYGMFY
ncbi:hypothetical protein Bca4012_019493 [Brassica carinata]